MSRMFCTLQEAAETLQASEDQVQALLERGLLHEFREGPHRLVKASDIGALALLRKRRAKGRRPAQPPTRANRASSPRSAKPKANRPAGMESTDAPPTATRLSRSRNMETQGPKRRETGPAAQDPARRSERDPRACPTRSAARPAASATPLGGFDSRSSERPSVRQWFWMGLIQDRPAAIAILAGLILLLLSALAAGVGLLAERL